MWPGKKKTDSTITGHEVRTNPPTDPHSQRNIKRVARLELALKKYKTRKQRDSPKFKSLTRELKIRKVVMED